MVVKQKIVTRLYDRYCALGLNPEGFHKWLDGVNEKAMTELEREYGKEVKV